MIVKGNIFLRFYRRFGHIGHLAMHASHRKEHGGTCLRNMETYNCVQVVAVNDPFINLDYNTWLAIFLLLLV